MIATAEPCSFSGPLRSKQGPRFIYYSIPADFANLLESRSCRILAGRSLPTESPAFMNKVVLALILAGFALLSYAAILYKFS